MDCQSHSIHPRLVFLVFFVLIVFAPAKPFEWSAAQVQMEAKNARAAFTEDGKLTIHTGEDAPGSVTIGPRDGKAWDVSGHQAMEVTVHNPGANRVVPMVAVKSTDDALERWENGVENSLYLDPGETQKLLVYFTGNERTMAELYPWMKGMRAGPNTQLLGWKGVDTKSIDSITFSALDLSGEDKFQPGAYVVEGIRPVKFHALFGYPAETPFPFIDRYGQFKHGDWPGKIRSDAGFAERTKAESADLAAHPRPKEWNKWGGWAEGPKIPSTGYFHVRQVEGKWWFIDPEGCLFWSHGATGAGRSEAATVISGRETYFDPLPGTGDPLGALRGKGEKEETFDFYGANLFRKYGSEFRKQAEQHAHTRMASWAMNTFGNWSSGYELLHTPFTVPVHYTCLNIVPKLPDVWDPAFELKLKNILGALKQEGVVGSPWNIGFFIHNEIKFHDPQRLARILQGRPADQPAKVAWVHRLEAKYGIIESLNRAWKTDYESWSALLASTEKVAYKDMAADADQCFADYLDRFFRISRDACKEFFPNHLYLGSRLHGQEHPMVMRAAETYCDVIAYNLYVKNLAGWTGPVPGLKKPVMSTEFHFGDLDRGMFHTGLQLASDQKDRAEHYNEYVLSALKHPLFVGTHWFQYAPQSFTGRGDGENYQIGMLDITDTPSPELIPAVRAIGRALYVTRFGEGGPATR